MIVLVFLIGTFFGAILGMVFNTLIMESDAKDIELNDLRRKVEEFEGGNEQ